MKRMKPSVELLLTLLIFALPLVAQIDKPSTNDIVEPHDVTYCELSKDPAAYNHQLLRLTAFVTHGFEDSASPIPIVTRRGSRFGSRTVGTGNRTRYIAAPVKPLRKHVKNH